MLVTVVAIAFSLIHDASAATFSTNSSSSEVDVLPGDGTCATAAGRCTLLAALMEAEALPGPDEVHLRGLTHDLGQSVRVSESVIVTGPGEINLQIGQRLEIVAGGELVGSNLRLAGTVHVNGGDALLEDLTVAGNANLESLTVDDGSLLVRRSISEYGSSLIVNGGEATIESTSLGGPGQRERLVVVRGGVVRMHDVTIVSDMTSWRTNAAVELTGGDVTMVDTSLELTCANGIFIDGAHVWMERVDTLATEQHGDCSSTLDTTAVQVDSGSVAMFECSITAQVGRGVHVGATADVLLEDCTLTGVRGVGIESQGTLSIDGTRIVDGEPSWTGGGLWPNGGGGVVIVDGSTDIRNSFISGNDDHHEAGDIRFTRWGTGTGGGLEVRGGVATVMDTVVADNRAQGADYAAGGGIAVTGGSLHVERCLVADNMVRGDGASVAVLEGSLTLVNTTISGGSAMGAIDYNSPDTPDDDVPYGGSGVAVFVSEATARLLSSTIAEHAPGSTAVFVDPAGLLSIGHVIVANPIQDCSGTIDSEGPNLLEDTTGCTLAGALSQVLTGVDPLLGPLVRDGTSRAAHELTPGSPAIDAGWAAPLPDGRGGDLTVDQRGADRRIDGNSDGTTQADLGAHEHCTDTMDSDGDGIGDSCDPIPCSEVVDVGVIRFAGASTLALSWSGAATASFEIYEGELTSLRSGGTHEALACAVSGTNANVLPATPNDAYYLMGARCGALRSSLGASSNGTPRSVPAMPCP